MSQPDKPQEAQPKRWLYLLPLALFAVLMVVFVIGLGLNPTLLPSPLIGKPAPQFSLPMLSNLEQKIQQTDLKGGVKLLNVWATWCVACRQEHPVLMKIAKSSTVPIYGLFYRDDPALGVDWLKNFGNPYRAIAADVDGKVGIEWGVYGAPETFIIDKEGIVRYKHVGPISWQEWQSILLPKIESIRSNGGV